MDQEDHLTEIVYDYKTLGEDEVLIKTDEYQWCVKQCYKMCFYVQKCYGIEILKMRAEFSKDENGSVRFNKFIFLDMVCLCFLNNDPSIEGFSN